jgi:hypothetical protein
MARAASTAALLALAAAACSEPIQYGGPIAIDEAGMQTRMRALCRAGMAGHAEAKCDGEQEGIGREQ